jgi:hypothetical protein
MTELGRRITAVTGVALEGSFLFQSISIAINAAMPFLLLALLSAAFPFNG